jgi:hypothetical protein
MDQIFSMLQLKIKFIGIEDIFDVMNPLQNYEGYFLFKDFGDL